MAQLTIRRLDENLVRRLKVRAAENGRSTEAAVRAILATTLMHRDEDFWARADAFRCSIGKGLGEDSTALLRRERDRRSRRLARLARRGATGA